MALFGSPDGILGGVSEWIFGFLTVKYVTLIINSFALVGFYIITRLILSLWIGWKSLYSEGVAVFGVIWLALSGGLYFARCDVFIFCADDLDQNKNCEVDWDRQGPNCR